MGLVVVAVGADIGMVTVAGSGNNSGVLGLVDVEHTLLFLLLLLLY